MRILAWLVRAFVFFSLFAFALNNRQPVAVNWFFGASWTAPLVIIVLVAFGAGCVIGVMAMVPNWWRERRAARRQAGATRPASTPAPNSTLSPPSGYNLEHPPREGL